MADKDVKGREWYQKEKTAEKYEEIRFSKGGQIINTGEKQALLDILGNIEGKKILELACGTGRVSVGFSKRKNDVVGIDVSWPMLKRARIRKRINNSELEHSDFEDSIKNLENLDSRPMEYKNSETGKINLVRGDAASLPFIDSSFDVTIAVRFFHLVDNPEIYLKEASRVSSTIVFDTFNRKSARVLYNRFLPMGSSLYSKKEVEEFVDKAGLKIIDRKDDFFFPFGFYRNIPKQIAKPIRNLDKSIQKDGSFCSVSYWKVGKK